MRLGCDSIAVIAAIQVSAFNKYRNITLHEAILLTKKTELLPSDPAL